MSLESRHMQWPAEIRALAKKSGLALYATGYVGTSGTMKAMGVMDDDKAATLFMFSQFLATGTPAREAFEKSFGKRENIGR